jgi:membrane-associated phospholipid phosphatase
LFVRRSGKIRKMGQAIQAQKRTEYRRRILLYLFISLLIAAPAQATEDIERAGDILALGIPATAYGITFVFDDIDGRVDFYKSFFTTIGITYGLKFTVDKRRPNGGPQSFPSAHASAAFSGASFMEKRYGLKYGIPAYITASFAGWSRVESNNHYPEDVLMGAAIGIITTYYFTKPYNRRLNLMPIAGYGMYGVALKGEW